MALEIERKYLLYSTVYIPYAISRTTLDISQGWIGRLRLRHSEYRTFSSKTKKQDKNKYQFCIKFGVGISRFEFEYNIPRFLFNLLWPLTKNNRVLKRRIKVPSDGLTWEIDIFLDRELFLAEIELPYKDTKVVIPSWLEPLIIREVTGESKYVNINLAK